ncbi:hypothetical protein BSKO_02622 [Bryopsis sp. KO-2023]|nr:hypothetical protein BSKO_02622 [Bryopsis sp. KO-2023]
MFKHFTPNFTPNHSKFYSNRSEVGKQNPVLGLRMNNGKIWETHRLGENEKGDGVVKIDSMKDVKTQGPMLVLSEVPTHDSPCLNSQAFPLIGFERVLVLIRFDKNTRPPIHPCTTIAAETGTLCGVREQASERSTCFHRHMGNLNEVKGSLSTMCSRKCFPDKTQVLPPNEKVTVAIDERQEDFTTQKKVMRFQSVVFHGKNVMQAFIKLPMMGRKLLMHEYGAVKIGIGTEPSREDLSDCFHSFAKSFRKFSNTTHRLPHATKQGQQDARENKSHKTEVQDLKLRVQRSPSSYKIENVQKFAETVTTLCSKADSLTQRLEHRADELEYEICLSESGSVDLKPANDGLSRAGNTLVEELGSCQGQCTESEEYHCLLPWHWRWKTWKRNRMLVHSENRWSCSVLWEG